MKKRLCAILLTAAVLLALIPATVITSSAADTDDVVFQNFDTLTSANITGGGGTVVIDAGGNLGGASSFALESAGSNTQSGQGMLLNLPATTPGSNPYFILSGTGMDVKPSTTEYKGLKFWVKYIGNSPVTVCISMLGSGQMDPQLNGTYYLQDAVTGVISKYRLKVSNHNASRGAMELPANFEGWVYYSLDSYTSTQRTNVNAPTRIQIADFYSASNTVGRKIYFDSFHAYKTAPTNIIEDFDGTLTGVASVVQGSSTATVNCDGTGTINTDPIYSDSGKSFKLDLSAVSTNKWFALNQMGLVNTNLVEGIKFWAKNTGSTSVNVCLSPYDDGSMKEFGHGSGQKYYLEYADGDIAAFLLTQSSRNASAGTTTLPSNFEGWVYIPFNSLIDRNLKSLNRIQFGGISTTDAESGRALYFDSVELYTDAVTPNVNKILVDDAISVDDAVISTSKAYSKPGAEITVTVIPAEGVWLVKDSLNVNDGEVNVTKVSESTYTFTMPDDDVVITAEFELYEDALQEIINYLLKKETTIDSKYDVDDSPGVTILDLLTLKKKSSI